MKKYIIIVSVYDEENTQAYPLGGVFDNEEQAKEYIRKHVYEVIDSHWTKGRRNTEDGYQAEYTFHGDFVAQDMYSGQYLEIEIREVPVMSNYFAVCCVAREDVEQQGFDSSNLSDEDMERIASKMDDLIREGCDYWNALDAACEYWEIPRKEE